LKKLKKCPTCSLYTLQKTCPRCGAATSSPHPPRFSPTDKFGEYRRMMKRRALAQPTGGADLDPRRI